jgi:hypothetical protein
MPACSITDRPPVNNIGPQHRFPVPEGILNYHGHNDIGLFFWALQQDGAKLTSLELEVEQVVQSGFGPVEMSPTPPYAPRPHAY